MNTPFGGSRQVRGFGLLESMLLLLLLGGVLLAGYTWLMAAQTRERAEWQAQLLATADRQVAGFAQANQRLPCIDTDGDGLEDCATLTNKGWLPLRTLGLDNEGGARGTPRLRYVVYRSGEDLALLTNRYEASNWELGEPKAYNQVNGFDFCTLLDGAMVAAAQTNAAHFTTAIGAVANVAYGLAVAGEFDNGTRGTLFDSDNDSDQALLAAPYRLKGVTYDDTVRVRSFSSLSGDLSCAANLGAMRAMALAGEVIKEVDSQQEALRQSAIIGSSISGVKLAISVVKSIMSGLAMAKAGTTLGVAAGQLATAIALCAVLVGCADIPRAAAAVALSVVALVASGVALGLNVTASVYIGTAMALSIAAAIKAGAEIDPDLQAQIEEATGGKSLYDAALDEIEASRLAAQASLAQAVLDQAAAQQAYDGSLQARTDAEAALRARAAAAQPGDDKDGKVRDQRIAAMSAYIDAVAARAESDRLYSAAEIAHGSLTEQQGQLQTSLTDLTTRLAAAVEPARRDSLQRQLDNLQAESDRLGTEMLVTQATLDQTRADSQLAQGVQNTSRDAYYEFDPYSAFELSFPFFGPGVLDQYYVKVDKVDIRQYELGVRDRELAEYREQLEELNRAQAELVNVDPAPGGIGDTVWSGAEAILQQMDIKGIAR